MPQEFPTTSLDITEDFHILHSAYVYICYSTLKAKTYNWLPNTHTHTLATATITNKKQLGTSHRLLIIPNGHLTGADIPFVCEILTTLTDKKKKYIFLLTLDWLWGHPQALLQ